MFSLAVNHVHQMNVSKHIKLLEKQLIIDTSETKYESFNHSIFDFRAINIPYNY
jgi:hypothetical protein